MNVDLASMIANVPSLQTQVSTAVLSMNLDSIKVTGENMTKLLEQSITPNLGQNIDLKI